MARTSLGPVIVDGKPRYVSPSAMSTADPAEYGGCPRRYWWKYVQGRKEPTTAAQTKGTEAVHTPIEDYLKGGALVTLPPLVTAGQRFIPEPGAGLFVEHGIAGNLLVAGIPVIGYIDVISNRNHYIDPEGDRRPNGNLDVVEVIDWKSTGDLSRAKTGTELLQTIQMTTYGMFAFQVWPDIDAVRLSHVYFRTKGAPASRKSTILARREDLRPTWERIERVGENIIDIAAQTSEDCVEANTRSCNAYGGCPHKKYCNAGNNDALRKLLAPGGKKMGLLDSLKPEVKAEVEALKAAEKKSPLMYSPAFAQAVASIEAAGQGFPALSGDAAKAYAQLKGRDFSGQGLAGSGPLGGLSFNELDKIVQVATELAALLPAAATHTQAVAVEPTPGTIATNTAMPVLLPPDAPTTAVPIEAQAEAPKAKRGRKAKEDSSPAADTAPASSPSPVTPTHPATAGLALFVDCIPSTAAASLDGYIEALCDELCQEFNAVDVRCAPGESPLGFGKWKGALAALAKSKPPQGWFSVDTRGREIAEVVTDALRGKASLYVRGIR